MSSIDVQMTPDFVSLRVDPGRESGGTWSLSDRSRYSDSWGASDRLGRFDLAAEPGQVGHRTPFDEFRFEPWQRDGLRQEIVTSGCERVDSIGLERRSGEGDDNDGHVQ